MRVGATESNVTVRSLPDAVVAALPAGRGDRSKRRFDVHQRRDRCVGARVRGPRGDAGRIVADALLFSAGELLGRDPLACDRSLAFEQLFDCDAKIARFVDQRSSANQRSFSALMSARDFADVFRVQQDWALQAATDYTEEATRLTRLFTTLSLTGTTPAVQQSASLVG